MEEKLENAVAVEQEDERIYSEKDEFLSIEDLVPIDSQAARRELTRVLGEINALSSENKWEEIVALFFPVEEKIPELVEHGIEQDVRAGVAFALGRLKRHDEAIRELTICTTAYPDNFMYQSSLGYTAYDSLMSAANNEKFLSGKPRAERIGLAHTHFRRAQQIRPDGVTNFYREGALLKNIEQKAKDAVPLFERAVRNWDALDETAQKARHQERKNFIKALYQGAGALLSAGRAPSALAFLRRCLAEDENKNYIELEFKYFALGKTLFHLNKFMEAKDALLFAIQCGGAKDFICELLARVYLAIKNIDKAKEAIQKVPENKRRPYFRWTEADVLCADGNYTDARKVLMQCAEKDKRSRHKALLKLAKIDYVLGNHEKAFAWAREADIFLRQRWESRSAEGLFLQAASLYRLGRNEEALGIALELKEIDASFPKLEKLLKAVRPGQVSVLFANKEDG
jgi:predicted negative regulator of RcsB-dependent stress response